MHYELSIVNCQLKTTPHTPPFIEKTATFVENYPAMNPQNNSYKDRNTEFLTEYSKRPGVKVLSNGVMYREITKGKGDHPTPKSLITVTYTGKLINGKTFDATEPNRPSTFKLSELITGWKSALKEMPIGARWEIVIPFNLGYGSRPAGIIKPFSTLVFDVRLLAIS